MKIVYHHSLFTRTDKVADIHLLWYILRRIPEILLPHAQPLPHGSHTDLKDKIRINLAIRAPELRVIGAEGENHGVIPRAEALRLAEEANLDLIEISPNAVPPIAKIMDYGKYQYEASKKQREVKAKSHTTETKGVQVKIGTGEHDLSLKAKKAAEWLTEGHRVKVDLFLWGRYKSMEESFLKERLERFLKLIPADYKIAEPIKRSPKGFSATVERVAKGKGATTETTNQ